MSKSGNISSKKISFVVKLLFVLISLSLFSISGNAQKKVGYLYFDTGSAKVIDLSKIAQRECVESIKEESGQSIVEVRFQPQFASEAKAILQTLKKAVEQTQEILSPLRVDGVRFYLLQMADAPKSYKIVLPKQDNLLLYAEVFDEKESIELDCARNQEFCRKLYQKLPHELTHPLLENLVNHNKNRWFEDGLAEYVATEVARRLSPNIWTSEAETSAQATLHRKEMRERIFSWGELNSADLTFKAQNKWRSEVEIYQAAQQLIRLIIEESKIKGIEHPLAALLEKLKQRFEQTKKPATQEELFALITQYLKVDVRTLGELDAQTQKSFVQEAIKMLEEEKAAPTPQKRFYALNILASIDKIALSDEWINFLLKIAYDGKEDEYIKALAATALARRLNQDNFDKVVEKWQQPDSNFKTKKLDTIKKDLQRNSLRPA